MYACIFYFGSDACIHESFFLFFFLYFIVIILWMHDILFYVEWYFVQNKNACDAWTYYYVSTLNVRMKNEKKKKKGMFPMCPIKVEI